MTDLKGDKWVLGRLPGESGDALVRFNVSARTLAGSSEFAARVGIAIPHELNNTSAVDEEPPAIDRIEDAVRQTVFEQTGGIHVITLTTAAVRELIFYMQVTVDFTSLLRTIRNIPGAEHVQMMAKRDPDWTFYMELSPN